MTIKLEAQIEAILFYKAEAVAIKKLANILNKDQAEIKLALKDLEKSLEGRGLSLIEVNEEVSLATNKECSAIIESLTKEELDRDLGKAGLETLSIILYKGPLSRAEIDYIRGVNSQSILRNLLVRGLIERTENQSDQRGFLYQVSMDFVSHLGLSKVSDIPEYEAVRKDIENFKNEGSQN